MHVSVRSGARKSSTLCTSCQHSKTVVYGPRAARTTTCSSCRTVYRVYGLTGEQRQFRDARVRCSTSEWTGASLDALDLTAAERDLARQIAEGSTPNRQTKTRLKHLPAAVTQLKRLLAARLGPEAGFARWRELVPEEIFPDADRVEARQLRSLRAAAEEASICIDVAPSGQSFEIHPPKVIGEGDHRILRNESRALYLTCLADARIRSGSAVVDAAGAALLDFEESEVAKFQRPTGLVSSDVDADPSLFYCDSRRVAWTLVPVKEQGESELDEAFSLFGMTCSAFGHWMSEYLPRYAMALMTGSLPPVPVLINEGLPKSYRQSLELLAPAGATIVEWPRFATVFVRKLWIGSKHKFPPIFSGVRWDYFANDPVAFAQAFEEIGRHLDRAVPRGRGPDKVYLARKMRLRRKLVNAAAIEQIAREAGFVIAYPEELSFAEQFRLVRDARFVLGPEGSALYLCMLCRPGSKVGILDHTHTEGVVLAAGLMDALGLDVTVITGPIVSRNEILHFSDYEIDVGRFRTFLADWLQGDSAQATIIPLRRPYAWLRAIASWRKRRDAS